MRKKTTEKKKLDKRCIFGKIKKMIAKGEITIYRVQDKFQISMTFKKLSEANPDAYLKKDPDSEWLIFYDGNKLIGYQLAK